MAAITSPDNPLVKRLVSLHDRKGRDEHGLFLVEGRRAVGTYVDAGWKPAYLLVGETHEIPDGWAATPVADRVLAKCSAAVTPSGYLAAFVIPDPVIDAAAGGLLLAGIQDPGNVGTIIRAAAAFAWGQVICCGGADPWGPKAVQAGAGSGAHLTITRVAATALPTGVPLTALVPRDGVPPEALLRGRRWLVVGGEGAGIPDDILSQCSERLTLPMPGGTESLNAAMAATIAAYLLAPSKC